MRAAIAETSGRRWYMDCRELARMTQAEREVPINARLLLDCRMVFQSGGIQTASRAGTSWRALKQQLGSSPSATFWLGAAGDLTSLARRLGEFGIETKSIRSGDDVEKGYRRESFEEAWLR